MELCLSQNKTYGFVGQYSLILDSDWYQSPENSFSFDITRYHRSLFHTTPAL